MEAALGFYSLAGILALVLGEEHGEDAPSFYPAPNLGDSAQGDGGEGEGKTSVTCDVDTVLW